MALIYTIIVWAGYLVLALVAAVLIAFVCICLYIKHVHRKFDHIPGPPRDNFVVGHLRTFLADVRSGRNINDRFLEWAEKYGPVCKINTFAAVVLFVTCPEATKEFLMSPKYAKDPYVNKLLSDMYGTRFLGNGLLTAKDHDLWYKQRRFMDPAFSSVYLRGLMSTFDERAERLMAKSEEYAESHTPAHMHKLINSFTLDVITKVAFGVDLDLLNAKDSPFPQAIELCLRGVTHHSRDPFFQFSSKNKKVVKEIKEAVQLLRETGATWISQRKRAILNGEDVPMDILTQILKSAEENKHEDEEIMIDNFITFFIAGQETTASQISFAIMELGRHPEILKRYEVYT